MGEMFDLEVTMRKLKEKLAKLQTIVQNDEEANFMDAASKFRI
jgi:hypothetical protein